MFKGLSCIVATVGIVVVGFSVLAADLSDEQIDQEISRMEKQAAVARAVEKKAPVTIAQEALPAGIELDKVFSSDTTKLSSSAESKVVDPAAETAAVAAVTADRKSVV